MKNSTKNTAGGLFHQSAGKAKVIAGKAINSPGLKAKGKEEILSGKIQKTKGTVQKTLGK